MKQRLAKRPTAVFHDGAVDPPTLLSSPAICVEADVRGAPSPHVTVEAAGETTDTPATAVVVRAGAVYGPSHTFSPPLGSRRGCLRTVETTARLAYQAGLHCSSAFLHAISCSFSSLLSWRAKSFSLFSHRRGGRQGGLHLDARRRGCHPARLRTRRRCCLLFLVLICVVAVADVLLSAALRLLHQQDDEAAMPAARGRATTLVGGARVPWLTCDCAGANAIGSVADLSAEELRELGAGLRSLYLTMDFSCGVCASAATATTSSAFTDIGGCCASAQMAMELQPNAPLSSLFAERHTGWLWLQARVSAIVHACLPGFMTLRRLLLVAYTDHVEAVAESHLQDRQNRGVEGPVPPRASPFTYVQALLRGFAGAEGASSYRQPALFLVDGHGDGARRACEARSPFGRVSPPRHALPWLEVRSARVVQTESDGAVVVRSPDVTVAVSSLGTSFRSYVCADTPNASRGASEFVVGATRSALRGTTKGYKGEHAEQRGGAAGGGDRSSSLRCGGCVFQCVHPRLLRRARSLLEPTAATASPRAGTALLKESVLSWDVMLEDVDAGRVRLPGKENKSDVVVTRGDLFTCALLHPPAETRDSAGDGGAAHHALLLAVDVWLSHFGGALPFLFANHSVSNTTAGGGDHRQQTRVPARLLPLHTAALYGESLQSFPDYALRMAHWTQFDAVYLPHVLRHQRSDSPRAAAAAAAAMGGTTFSTWTVAHIYQRDFELLVYLNQQLQHLRRRAPERTCLTAADLADMVHNASGVVPRLAVELLRGADPMLLPLVEVRGDGGQAGDSMLAWRPPTAYDWSSRATAAAAATDPSTPPRSRLPAIAVAISHCWHGRLWWLSELSRYYPVHNFGRCEIPTPRPLPGDVPERTAVPHPIPRRARYAVPASCRADHLQRQHLGALRSAPRALTHLARDYELRCIFRRYRYVLAFENSIEDDYVTEKVYNALLSGALPLYIGAMNIDSYVPHQRANASTSPSASPAALSVLPVLQIFPLLNVSATRLEDRRVAALHLADEAGSSRVWRTHASMLRRRAARARARLSGADATLGVLNGTVEKGCGDASACMAEVVASSMEGVAAQATSAAHALLYDTAAPQQTALHHTPESTVTAEHVSAHPAGVWPASAEERVEVGFDGFLRRVHDNVRRAAAAAVSVRRDTPLLPVTAAPYSNVSGGRGTRAMHATSAAAAVRQPPVRNFALTANTAFGFAEALALRRARGAAAASTALRAGSPLPDRVERFSDGDEDNTGNATQGDAAGASVRLRRGSAFSRFYLHRRLHDADAFYAAAGMLAGEGPPMNGFAQLAAYLRTLDADARRAAEAGYFDWWAAAEMAELGESFLESLHTPHPICGICAAALEKKEGWRP